MRSETRSATGIRSHLIRQTPVPEAGAVVVTCRYDYDGAADTWETRVEGGRLDGWTLTTHSAAKADAAHRGAVRLAREAAGA